jgi:hypothetical protein
MPLMKTNFDRLIRARLVLAGQIPKASARSNLAAAIVLRLKIAEALETIPNDEIYQLIKGTKPEKDT